MQCLTYIMLLCCSQRQHQFSGGAMGILRSVGAGCHVPGPGLLSQALLWSSASRLATPDLTISSVTILHPCFCTSFVCSFWVLVCWAFVCLGMGGSVSLCCCFELGGFCFIALLFWVGILLWGWGVANREEGRGTILYLISLVAVQLTPIYKFFMVEFWWFWYNTFIVNTNMNRLFQSSVVLYIKETHTYSDCCIGLEGGRGV